MSDPALPTTKQPHGGIHVSRGVGIRIPAGGLTIGFDSEGKLSARLNELHLQLNTCVDWLEIALEHLATAHAHHRALIEAHQSKQDVSALLQAEFRSAMQACVAAATFFEALYAASRDCLPATRNAPGRAGKGQSARPARVTEQLKRAFGLKQQGTKNLSSVLTEVYRFRDEAVHPAAAFGPPAIHPDLQLAVERRFAMYRSSSAHLLVRAALAYCEILPMVAQKQGPKEAQELAGYLLTAGEPLFKVWRSTYGALRDGEAAP